MSASAGSSQGHSGTASPAPRSRQAPQQIIWGFFCLFVFYKLLGEEKIPPFDPIKGHLPQHLSHHMMSRGCCLPHLNSQKPSSIPVVLLDPGVWKHPKGAEAAITGSPNRRTGFESAKTFCSSSAQSEPHKVTSKDTSKSSKIICYKHTATSKGLVFLLVPHSCKRQQDLSQKVRLR